MIKSKILDHTGRPFKVGELSGESQTSRIGALHNEFAHHPSRGLTPGRLASILQNAERGLLLDQCNLYADIEEKDGHVFAEMGKRKRALLGLNWDIRPPRNATASEQKAADLAKEIIGDIANFEDVLLDMADAIGYAYSNLEMRWQQIGKEWLPSNIDHRPPAWFNVLKTDRDQLRLRDGSMDGAELQPFTWISHIHKSTSGFLPRAGLHRVLAWPFLFKNYSVRDLAEFLEIYGLPLRLGTYPTGSGDDEKATLLRAVTTIGHNAAGIIPEGMMIDFKDAAKGASDPFMAMINWCEKTQSKAILGGTLTSQADGASSTNALGNVHNEVRHELLKSDAIQVARTLTRDLVYPIVLLNSGGIDSLRRCPQFVFDTKEPEDLKLYSEALPALANAGAKIPVAWVNKKLGIPEPEEGEEVLGFAVEMVNENKAAPNADAALKSTCPHCAQAALKGEQPDDVADTLAKQLDETTNDAMTGLINEVKKLVESSESFDELQEKLLDAYSKMDVDELALIMQQGFATAQLTGRFEIDEGE
ncbi:DUF935 domain-containing protein [Cardiobacterium sp. AH-315-I02]|nr:DUF935 domain-containing protein [Cardiobacterium sp. AH-315-I02]